MGSHPLGMRRCRYGSSEHSFFGSVNRVPSLGHVHQQFAADLNPIAKGLRLLGKTLGGVAPRRKGRRGALGGRGRLGIYTKDPLTRNKHLPTRPSCKCKKHILTSKNHTLSVFQPKKQRISLDVFSFHCLMSTLAQPFNSRSNSNPSQMASKQN